MTRWLLCDYGEVLSHPQSEKELAILAELAGADPTSWHETYWRHRPGYDKADLDAAGYWEVTLGFAPEPDQLVQLVSTDVRSWLHPNQEAIAAAGRAVDAGMGLAVLSNAPHDLADELDAQPWLSAFEPRLFSARLGITKPDPAIYGAAVEALGADPGDVWFLDDRPVNVEAAEKAGLKAVHYSGDPKEIDEVIRRARG